MNIKEDTDRGKRRADSSSVRERESSAEMCRRTPVRRRERERGLVNIRRQNKDKSAMVILGNDQKQVRYNKSKIMNAYVDKF